MSSESNEPPRDDQSGTTESMATCCGCGRQETTSPTAGKSPKSFRPCGCWAIALGLLVLFVVIFILLPVISPCREAARRFHCINNLKQLHLAMEAYHSAYGQFPPAYVADKDGRPMYSWRVLLIPFLEPSDFYDQFHHNEPWDSPHNLPLAKEYFAEFFRCPSQPKQEKPITSYVMIVGPDCLSQGSMSATQTDILHPKQTIILAEIADSDIVWTEPRDLDATTMSYNINDPQQLSISSKHPGGAHAIFANGHAIFLQDDIDPELIRKLTEPNAVLSDNESDSIEY